MTGPALRLPAHSAPRHRLTSRDGPSAHSSQPFSMPRGRRQGESSEPSRPSGPYNAGPPTSKPDNANTGSTRFYFSGVWATVIAIRRQDNMNRTRVLLADDHAVLV